jgi:hypothetical protein
LIVEIPPPDERRSSAPVTPLSQQNHRPERKSSHEPPPPLPPQTLLSSEPTGSRISKSPALTRPSRESSQTINEIISHPPLLPGNSTRTDNLSFIPTLTEDRKTEDKRSEGKKSKDRKDAEGPRKSSWHWLRGTEEKEKEKKKEEDTRRNKPRTAKVGDKGHDNTRLDLLQTSIDGGQRGRESIAIDRDSKLDPKLEEERRKESAKKSAGVESKKEKETGLLSFFGVKKKSSHEGHKKHSSRNLSPDPRSRVLKPDIDYNWTRFSILEERAIYRMAHIKLANPRRALYQQVLLSNFMYSYLAKVQQMHPLITLPSSASQNQQKKKDESPRYQRQQDVSSFLTSSPS